MSPELRRSPRYIFFASAEITETESQATMSARTSEICRHGCYLDMMNPFLDGTSLRVRITHDGQDVEAAARVVHSKPNVGMGISFDQIDAHQEPIIEQWLSALEAS
ncbi:MAG TPA: PilZ domain-containing protein [Verrucomicrobiae bacterium]|nr:PilZ domain-containing protein [Verrucomicrobiae bacterium]